MVKKPLKLNTASRATSATIGIAPIVLSIDDQNFTCNFIVCIKLKQHLILGLDFVQRYRIGIDWDMHGKLFLRSEGKKMATSMKIYNLEHQTIASLEISAGKQNETAQKLHLITNNTATIPPYHSSVAPLKLLIRQLTTLNLIP